MARLQQQLHKYVQKLTMLVGTKEPFFTMLCGHLDLLPPDPARLPDRSDDFLARMALHLEGGGQLPVPFSSASAACSHSSSSNRHRKAVEKRVK
eukprot:21403-Heterococcus_DN1.PRE.1